MGRRIGSFLVAGLMALAALPAAAHDGHRHQAAPTPAPSEVKVAINGRLLLLESPVYLVNGRTLLPFRAIFEALGAKVSWHQEDWSITAVSAAGDRTIQLAINDTRATVAGEQRSLDVPPQLYGSRTYVPLRFVAEALGAQVDWDADWQLVRITADQTYPATGVTYPIHMAQYDAQAWLAVYPPRKAVVNDDLPEEFPVQVAFDQKRFKAAYPVRYDPYQVVGTVWDETPTAVSFHPQWFEVQKKGFHIGLSAVDSAPTYLTASTTEWIRVPMPADLLQQMPSDFYYEMKVSPYHGGVMAAILYKGMLSNLDSRAQAFEVYSVQVSHPTTGSTLDTKRIHDGWVTSKVAYYESAIYELQLSTLRRFPPIRILHDPDNGAYIFHQSTFAERDGLK